jgi:hypothetical protein
MKRCVLLLVLAGCGPGSRDAPRPIAPYPEAANDFKSDDSTALPPADDDNDGIENDADGCPLAAESWSDPVRDGCPGGSPDAGVRQR